LLSALHEQQLQNDELSWNEVSIPGTKEFPLLEISSSHRSRSESGVLSIMSSLEVVLGGQF
jgi:hypothetical protein